MARAKSPRSESDASTPSRKSAESSPVSCGYASLIDILPVGIFTIDGERRILSINPSALDLLGWTAEEAEGRTCAELLQCSFCAPTCAACVARDEAETQRNFPADIKHADGTSRSVLIDAVPLDNGNVAVLLKDVTESERLRRALQDRWVFHGLVCVSESMKEVIGKVRDVAPYDSTVLILGESGTGKELVARALHAESERASKPFVVVNCSAYSETLLESELFGHARGSFTGAERDRRGRFEIAEGGTVLLDEIAEISPWIQVKLLRVLQEREIERVGENQPRRIDLRVLASTNRDLWREVKEGRFREDLFYRLNVVTLDLPPLRERKEDIPALVDHILGRLKKRMRKNIRGVAEEVMTKLLSHTWPGNIRELENVLENAAIQTTADIVSRVDLREGGGELGGASPADRMRAALTRTAGCVTRAARILGVHRTTLWRRMREAGIHRDEFLQG